MKTLEDIRARDYGLDVESRIAANLIQYYMIAAPQKMVEESIEKLIGANDEERQITREQVQVDTARLAEMIDFVASYLKQMIENQILEDSDMTENLEKEIQILLRGLTEFKAERIAENCTDSFCDFLYDCYLVAVA